MAHFFSCFFKEEFLRRICKSGIRTMEIQFQCWTSLVADYPCLLAFLLMKCLNSYYLFKRTYKGFLSLCETQVNYWTNPRPRRPLLLFELKKHIIVLVCLLLEDKCLKPEQKNLATPLHHTTVRTIRGKLRRGLKPLLCFFSS